jgi:hypothetical protein
MADDLSDMLGGEVAPVKILLIAPAGFEPGVQKGL